LEEQLSLIDLVINASFTVQMVMLILVGASILSWYMIVQRFLYLHNARE
jgi:biopolymer transport protein TolQ